MSESRIVLFNLTTNVYEVPFVKPVTVIGDVELVPVKSPGEDVAVKVKEEFGFPVYAGNVKTILAELFAGLPPPIIGVPGLRPLEEDIGPIFVIMQLRLQELPTAQYHA